MSRRERQVMPHSPRGSCGQGAVGMYLVLLPVARQERKDSKMELLVEDQTVLAPTVCGYGLIHQRLYQLNSLSGW